MHNCGVPPDCSVSPFHARYRNWDKISNNQYLPKCPCRDMDDCDCNSYCKITQYVDHCLKKNLVSPADNTCNNNRCVCKKRRESFRNCSTDCELKRLRRILKKECCCRCLADESNDEHCDCPRLICCKGAQEHEEEQSRGICGYHATTYNTPGSCVAPCRSPPSCMKIPNCVGLPNYVNSIQSNLPSCINTPVCMKKSSCINTCSVPSPYRAQSPCRNESLCMNESPCMSPTASVDSAACRNESLIMGESPCRNESCCIGEPSCRSKSPCNNSSHCRGKSPCRNNSVCEESLCKNSISPRMSPISCVNQSQSTGPSSCISLSSSGSCSQQSHQNCTTKSVNSCKNNSDSPCPNKKSTTCRTKCQHNPTQQVPKKCPKPSYESENNSSNGQSFDSTDQSNCRQVATCDVCSCPVYEEFIMVDDENVDEPSFICVPNYINISSPTRSFNSVDVFEDYSEPPSQYSFVTSNRGNYPSEITYNNQDGEWSSVEMSPTPDAMGSPQQPMGSKSLLGSRQLMGSKVPQTMQVMSNQAVGQQILESQASVSSKPKTNTQSFNMVNQNEGNENYINQNEITDEENSPMDQMQVEGDAGAIESQQEQMSRETRSLLNPSGEAYYSESLPQGLTITEELEPQSLPQEPQLQGQSQLQAYPIQEQQLQVQQMYQGQDPQLQAQKTYQGQDSQLQAQQAYQGQDSQLQAQQAYQIQDSQLQAQQTYEGQDPQLQAQQIYQTQEPLTVSSRRTSEIPTNGQEQFSPYIPQTQNVMYCRPTIQVCTTQRRSNMERVPNLTPIVKICKSMPPKNVCFSPHLTSCKKSIMKRKRSFQGCELDSVQECPDLE